MSANRISRRTAEQMLRGSSAGHPLADLLARAAAPGRPDEVTGEAGAVAAFQAALTDQPVPVPSQSPRERRSSLRSSLAKALTVKAAGIILVVCGVGGVAIAANGGVPGITSREEPRKHTPKSVAPTMVPKHAPTPVVPAPSPTPDLAELCRAYLTQGKYAKQLAPLIKAAGGRQKVIGFCFTLLGGDKARPGGGWPTGWPQNWPKGWPKDQKWPSNWPQGLPQEWIQPSGEHRPDSRNRKQKRKKQSGSSPELQLLWPEDWPELKF